MAKSKHTEAQIITALKKMDAGQRADDVAREYGVSKHTIYAWKAKYGGMDVTEAQEAKRPRDENGRLRKLVGSGVPGLLCTSSSERDWTQRSGRWRRARSILLNRL
jgi:putative transposase